MSIVVVIDDITTWVQDHICSKIELKLPPEKRDIGSPSLGKNDNNSYNSEYKLVKPTAFPMYMPTDDKLPPKVDGPIPSIIVQFVDGHDDVISKKGRLKIQLGFSAWNPGVHGKDMFDPKDNPDNLIPVEYEKWDNEKAKDHYIRNADGWRDCWNFVDLARREIESTNILGGYGLDIKSGFDFGAYKEQDDIVDYNPFWFAWMSFYINYGVVRSNPESNFL